jgi:hypothetical protein
MKQNGPSRDPTSDAIGPEVAVSIAADLRRGPAAALPVILCFFTGEQPSAASAMPRDPAPPVGTPFVIDFAQTFAEALALNPAVHDGAVMIGRDGPDQPYLVAGWSHRLHPAQAGKTVTNKGSAFNSCAAMSTVDRVDALVLIGRDEAFAFRRGVPERLQDTSADRRPETIAF